MNPVSAPAVLLTYIRQKKNKWNNSINLPIDFWIPYLMFKITEPHWTLNVHNQPKIIMNHQLQHNSKSPSPQILQVFKLGLVSSTYWQKNWLDNKYEIIHHIEILQWMKCKEGNIIRSLVYTQIRCIRLFDSIFPRSLWTITKRRN